MGSRLHLLLWFLLLLAISALPRRTTVGSLVCLRGSYLSGSFCAPCPGGTFGNRPGIQTRECSGECLPGYFCPPGSTVATARACGGSTYYCPRGSAMRQPVSDGFYTTTFRFDRAVPSSISTADRQKVCERGFYCVNGIRRTCPAGSYGATTGLSTLTCSGSCPRGFYCPEGTSDPLACPPGSFGADLGLSTAQCGGLCPVGHYCEAATVTPRPCPPGSFGGSTGLTTKRCSSRCSSTTTCAPSPCPAGFYCPLAATSPVPCGDVGAFCPEGSSSPRAVTVGYYSIRQHANNANDDVLGRALADVHLTTRSDQRLCEQGAYCVSGVKRLCPAGTYGASQGLSTAQCSGPCPAGFYCPLGTADYFVYPCAERTQYCRPGSTTPCQVSVGFYTIVASTADVRINQTVCPPGSYCLGGVKYLCPTGTYGATSGLATSSCSGRCQDGYICPMGATSATQTPCPAGQYSRNGGACAPCLPGYWCSAASPDPKQNACGSDAAFCPLGSSGPTSVAAGYFAVGQSAATHTSQAMCVVQSAQHIPQCPSRTIGINSGL